MYLHLKENGDEENQNGWRFLYLTWAACSLIISAIAWHVASVSPWPTPGSSTITSCGAGTPWAPIVPCSLTYKESSVISLLVYNIDGITISLWQLAISLLVPLHGILPVWVLDLLQVPVLSQVVEQAPQEPQLSHVPSPRIHDWFS